MSKHNDRKHSGRKGVMGTFLIWNSTTPGRTASSVCSWPVS